MEAQGEQSLVPDRFLEVLTRSREAIDWDYTAPLLDDVCSLPLPTVQGRVSFFYPVFL